MKIFLVVYYLYAFMVISFCFILKGDIWSNTAKRQLDLNYGSKDTYMKINNFEIETDKNSGYKSYDKRKDSNINKTAEQSSDKLIKTTEDNLDNEDKNKLNNNSDDTSQINKTEISYEVHDPYSDVDHTIYNEIRDYILPVLINVIEHNNKSNEFDNYRPSTDKIPYAYEDNINTNIEIDETTNDNITEDNSDDKNRHVNNKTKEIEDYKPSLNADQNSYEVYETDTDGAESNYNKLYGFVPIDRTALTRGHGYAIFGKRYAIYVPVETNAREYSDVNRDSFADRDNNIIENITEKF